MLPPTESVDDGKGLDSPASSAQTRLTPRGSSSDSSLAQRLATRRQDSSRRRQEQRAGSLSLLEIERQQHSEIQERIAKSRSAIANFALTTAAAVEEEEAVQTWLDGRRRTPERRGAHGFSRGWMRHTLGQTRAPTISRPSKVKAPKGAAAQKAAATPAAEASSSGAPASAPASAPAPAPALAPVGAPAVEAFVPEEEEEGSTTQGDFLMRNKARRQVSVRLPETPAQASAPAPTPPPAPAASVSGLFDTEADAMAGEDRGSCRSSFERSSSGGGRRLSIAERSERFSALRNGYTKRRVNLWWKTFMHHDPRRHILDYFGLGDHVAPRRTAPHPAHGAAPPPRPTHPVRGPPSPTVSPPLILWRPHPASSGDLLLSSGDPTPPRLIHRPHQATAEAHAATWRRAASSRRAHLRSFSPSGGRRVSRRSG